MDLLVELAPEVYGPYVVYENNTEEAAGDGNEAAGDGNEAAGDGNNTVTDERNILRNSSEPWPSSLDDGS